MNIFPIRASLFLPAVFLLHLSRAAHATDVDLQFAICERNPGTVLSKLREDSAKEHRGWVTYYDTVPVRWARQGVSLRTKHNKGGSISSVKIRFAQEKPIPSADCEWDSYRSDSFTCAVEAQIDETNRPWSHDQQEFGNHYAGISFDHLESFGPFVNRKWKLDHRRWKVVFDSVETPKAGSLMEISVKVAQAEAANARAEIEQWLRKREVRLCANQVSKTIRLFTAMGLL